MSSCIQESNDDSIKPLIVYGSRNDGMINPVAYLLKYDVALERWLYPTSNGKPLEWKRVSSIYKESQVLQPGAALEFWMLYGSAPNMDGNKRLKVSARISCRAGKTPFEIRSEEFVVR